MSTSNRGNKFLMMEWLEGKGWAPFIPDYDEPALTFSSRKEAKDWLKKYRKEAASSSDRDRGTYAALAIIEMDLPQAPEVT